MAQISILVKPESLAAKGKTLMVTMPWKIAQTLEESGEVYVQIDEEVHRLRPAEEPYLFNVRPGRHVMYAEDGHAAKKLGISTVSKAAFSAGFALMGGSVSKALGDSVDNSNSSFERAKEKHSYVEFDVMEGETVKFECKATAKGIAKIKRVW